MVRFELQHFQLETSIIYFSAQLEESEEHYQRHRQLSLEDMPHLEVTHNMSWPHSCSAAQSVRSDHTVDNFNMQ
eukprot:gene2922-8169_t